MPPTIKELFRWCLFFYLTNSTIGPIIRKKASYLITDLIYSTMSSRTKDIWKNLLEKSLKIKEFEFILMIDFEVFGNAYASIIYPFDRFLVCKSCGFENLIGSSKWEYDGANFIVKCKECHTKQTAKVKDVPVRNRNRVRLHRWFPMYIDPKKNPITGKTRYIYRIPGWIKNKVKDQKINKIYVEDTPLEFLEAIKKNQVIELDPDNLYHFKHESVSMDDDSLGIPQLLNVMKDAWLYSTYNKSQEAVALEHVLPLDLISPAPAAGAPAPHMSTDLGTWRGRIQNIISNWRRDPNALFPVPFPVQVSRVRGDAQALTLHNDLQMVRQQIAGGLDVPPDFVYGNMTWSGGNVTLRVLENLLINRLSRLEFFVSEWVVPRMRRFFLLPACEIRHQEFKMADDVQQKRIAMELRATNTVSDKTVLEELGFDPHKEEVRKNKEMEQRLADMRKQQIAQAEIEAEVNIIRAKAEAEIRKVQQESMGQPGMEGQMPAEQIPTEVQPAQAPAPQAPARPQAPPPEVLEAQVMNFMKSVPPEQQEYQLNVLAQQDPMLARAIRSHLLRIQKGNREAFRPLPEQKPPARGPETALV
jgi:hypothetical protein